MSECNMVTFAPEPYLGITLGWSVPGQPGMVWLRMIWEGLTFDGHWFLEFVVSYPCTFRLLANPQKSQGHVRLHNLVKSMVPNMVFPFPIHAHGTHGLWRMVLLSTSAEGSSTLLWMPTGLNALWSGEPHLFCMTVGNKVNRKNEKDDIP